MQKKKSKRKVYLGVLIGYVVVIGAIIVELIIKNSKWVFKKGGRGAGCFHIIYVREVTLGGGIPDNQADDLSIYILY